MEILRKILRYVSFPMIGARAFLLEGPAGAGKTYLTREVANALGAEYEFFQAYPGVRFSDLTYDYVPAEDTRSGIRLAEGVLVKAARKSKHGLVVLVLDEYDKTLASSDSYLLDYLQNGRVYFADELVVANVSNLIVFLTSNGAREFSEPLLRRVVRIKMSHVPADRMRKLLSEKFDDAAIINVLVKVYEKTVALNLRKPATLPELVALGYALLAGEDLREALVETVLKYDDDLEALDEIVAAAEGKETPTHHEKTGTESPTVNVTNSNNASNHQNAPDLFESGADHEQILNDYVNHKLPSLSESSFFRTRLRVVG